MTEPAADLYDRVGPVLQTGAVGAAIVAAIRDLNSDVMVVDRGAYLRVMVPRRCFVTRAAIEKHLDARFASPENWKRSCLHLRERSSLVRKTRSGNLPEPVRSEDRKPVPGEDL